MGNRVIVVGGGAAGLLAAGFAGKQGANVLLIEKNPILAKKIRISGKGRCNITNARSIREFIDYYPGNGKFLYSALHQFTNLDLLNLVNKLGLSTKVERGQRVFPISDDANQVAETLIKFAQSHGVEFKLNTSVIGLRVTDQCIDGVETTHGYYPADQVIISTGGASYPKTGSNGDGYRLAKKIGHGITPPLPALVGLRTMEQWVGQISGLSLKNVTVTITNGKNSFNEFGEMQFAHFGITGPSVLTLSRQVAHWLQEGFKVEARIDLKPALNNDELDARIQRDFQTYQRKQFKNSLDDLLPKSLIPIIIEQVQIKPEKHVHQITRAERGRLVTILKALPLRIKETLPLATAIVTAGGINVQEINPKTMESKLINGLYFAGEVMDIDGVTGGYNLQAAFSTGYLAGINASKV